MKTLRNLMKSAAYEEAIRYGLELLDKDSDKGLVCHIVGDAFYNLKLFQLAAKFYADAIIASSLRPWTYFNLGRALEALNDPKSVEYMDCAISMDGGPEFLFGKAKNRFTPDVQRLELFRKVVNKDRRFLFRDWGIQHMFPQRMRGDLHRIISKERKAQWFIAESGKYDRRFEGFARLTDKVFAQQVVQRLGLDVPRQIASGLLEGLSNSISESRYVIKPKRGSSSKGISLVDDRFDLFKRQRFESSFLELYEPMLSVWKSREFIVEELIRDVDSQYDPYLNIPRDFKCFAAEGEFFWVNIYDRNYPKISEMKMACYDENWTRLSKTAESYRDAGKMAEPKYFDELKEAVCLLSRNFPYFMRFDFYLSDRGPVFGEFTHTPSEGMHQTEFGERTQLQLLFLYPDGKEPRHNREVLEH